MEGFDIRSAGPDIIDGLAPDGVPAINQQRVGFSACLPDERVAQPLFSGCRE